MTTQPSFFYLSCFVFWHPGFSLTFCLDKKKGSKKSRLSHGVCRQLSGMQFTFWGGTAAGLRYRPELCPLLMNFTLMIKPMYLLYSMLFCNPKKLKKFLPKRKFFA
jgi:hypothetical protein